VDAWFYKELAGIKIDEGRPGYEHVVIRPYMPDDLTRASASVDTIRGVVASSWRKDGDRLYMDVTIPANSTASVHVPTQGGEVTEGGDSVWDGTSLRSVPGLRSAEMQNGVLVFEIGSGSYSFQIQIE